MSKDSETFEQLFRDRLYRYQVNPPAHMWGAISARRKVIANRRWYLLLFLILLLFSALLLGLLNAGSEEAGPFAADYSSPSEVITSGVYSDLEEDTQAGHFITHTESKAVDQAEISDKHLESSTSNADYRTAQTSGYSSDLSSSGDGVYISGEPVSMSSVNGALFEEENYSVADRQDNQSEMNRHMQGNPATEGDLSGYYEMDFNSTVEFNAEGISAGENLTSERKILSEVALLNFLTTKSSGFVEKSKTERQLTYEFDICGVPRNPICFESRYPLRFFAIDLLAGPDFFDKLIQPKSRDDQEYADMRLASESSAFSYGAMARFSAVFQNGLALRTGIAVNQINEKFTWKDPDAVNRRVVNVLIDTIINAPMDTTFVFDTLSIIESGTRVREIHNRYQMIDIPFLVGAEFHNGNWTFTSSVGVMFNLAFEKSGEILAENGKPMVINNNESGNDIFRSSLGMSFSGSFGVGYRIGPQYSILIEPRVKYQLKPLTIENYVLNQNYFIFGVHAGLRYKFK